MTTPPVSGGDSGGGDSGGEPDAGGGTVTPSGDLQELLRQAQEAADAAQAEIDRLRAILEQIESDQGE